MVLAITLFCLWWISGKQTKTRCDTHRVPSSGERMYLSVGAKGVGGYLGKPIIIFYTAISLYAPEFPNHRRGPRPPPAAYGPGLDAGTIRVPTAAQALDHCATLQ